MNNFDNILTKTESLTTLQGGLENSESGGRAICWTLASYILLRFLQEQIAKFHKKKKKQGRDLFRPPLNQPMHYLH